MGELIWNLQVKEVEPKVVAVKNRPIQLLVYIYIYIYFICLFIFIS